MSDTSLHLALREMRALFARPRVLAVCAVVVLVLGLTGPFQTYDVLPLVPRLLYWAAVALGTFFIGSVFGRMAAEFCLRRQAPFWMAVICGGLCASLPATLVVLAINWVVFGPAAYDAFSPFQAFAYIFIISTSVSVLFALFDSADKDAQAKTEVGTPILSRVPLQKRGKLISLTVQDHYVDVITSKGTHLVLMRLSDAMKETGSVQGLQIHRSHWVALDGIKSVARDNGKWMVVTETGQRLPVSRSFQPAAKQAGLLA